MQNLYGHLNAFSHCDSKWSSCKSTTWLLYASATRHPSRPFMCVSFLPLNNVLYTNTVDKVKCGRSKIKRLYSLSHHSQSPPGPQPASGSTWWRAGVWRGRQSEGRSRPWTRWTPGTSRSQRTRSARWDAEGGAERRKHKQADQMQPRPCVACSTECMMRVKRWINKNSTSISAALSCPKKTFLMNFPSRNTNTKAWMYNTWRQKGESGFVTMSLILKKW